MNKTLSFWFDHSYLYSHSTKRRVGWPTHPGLPRAFLVLALRISYPGSPSPRAVQSGTVGQTRVESVSYLYPRYPALYPAHDNFSMKLSGWVGGWM